MTWKGIIIEESLENKNIFDLVNIVKIKKTTLENESKRGIVTFNYIEVKDKNKDNFLDKAKNSIKDRFYIHICKNNQMIVIFKDKIFEFSNKDINKLKDTRNYGLSVGILKEQMPFELLIKNPYA